MAVLGSRSVGLQTLRSVVTLKGLELEVVRLKTCREGPLTAD
jgi:hypothetical protein